MELYELIEKYGKGKGEAVMWETTKLVSDFIKPMKETNKEEYWRLMREVYGKMSGGHYDEVWAMYDVSKMLPVGEHWSMKQIEEATRGMTFPNGTTLCDKYVAFNAFANDLNGVLSDEEIIKAAHAFWFADKDYPKNDKIWRYMGMVYSAK